MNVIPSSLQPKCPNCQGSLSFTHNKVLTFLSCNGKCKETFELHSAEEMVKFFEAVPEQAEEFEMHITPRSVTRTVKAPKVLEETKYKLALKWIKMLWKYGEFTGACGNALREDGELKELLRETDRIG